MSGFGNFRSERHALYRGWVAGMAAKHGMKATPEVDGDGNYTDRLLIDSPTLRVTLIVPEPPDDWGGRAAVEWLERLAAGNRFDPEAERLTTVARVIDAIYGR